MDRTVEQPEHFDAELNRVSSSDSLVVLFRSEFAPKRFSSRHPRASSQDQNASSRRRSHLVPQSLPREVYFGSSIRTYSWQRQSLHPRISCASLPPLRRRRQFGSAGGRNRRGIDGGPTLHSLELRTSANPNEHMFETTLARGFARIDTPSAASRIIATSCISSVVGHERAIAPVQVLSFGGALYLPPSSDGIQFKAQSESIGDFENVRPSRWPSSDSAL